MKKTLGHLVDGGRLDLAQIDAGIGSGRIEVRNVQLNAGAINNRLSSLPITLVAGQIGKILIQLPVPNFWSGELSVTVSDISSSVKLSSREVPGVASFTEDLSASFASAASQIFVDDDEAKDLEQSIHQSLSADNLQEAQQQSSEEQGSLIATYVEALLTRLKVTVEGVQVHLQSDLVDLSLRLQNVLVQSSNTRTDHQAQQPRVPESTPRANAAKLPETSHRRLISETVRTIHLQGLELWLQDKRKHSEPQVADDEEESDSSYEEDVPARLYSSQDMHQSTASLRDSSASLYESAIGESAFHEALEHRSNANLSKPLEALKTQTSSSTKHLLFSLGPELTTVTFTTTKERHELPVSGSASRGTSQRLVGVDTNVDVHIGNAGAVLFIDHASLLMMLFRSFMSTATQTDGLHSACEPKAQPATQPPRSNAQRRVALSCHVSSFNLIVGYDDPAMEDPVQASLQAFWARPSRSHPDFGHLRLRMERLTALLSNDTDSRTTSKLRSRLNLAIGDVGLFEYLPANLFQQCPAEASRVLPVIILDPNLAQSSHSTPATSKHSRHDYAMSTVEVFDWRYSVPFAGEAQPNSFDTSRRAARFKTSDARPSSSSSGHTPYFRTAFGDRAWRLKPSTKSQYTPQSNVPEATSPNLSVSIVFPRVHEDQGSITASVAPIHCFVDVSLVTRLMPALRKFAAEQITALQEVIEPGFELADSISSLTTSVATVQGSARNLLDDLAAHHVSTGEKGAYSLDLKVHFVRIEMRTSQVSFDAAALAGRDLSSARKIGLDRRSGILVVQLQGLGLRSGLAEIKRPPGGVRFARPPAEANRWQDTGSVMTAEARAERVSAYLALPSESRALVLALIEPVHDSHSESEPFANLPAPLPLQIRFSHPLGPTQDCSGGAARDYQLNDRCTVLIPSIKVELGKGQLDSLQYVVDDLTQSINFWTSDDLDDSDSLDAEGLRILGSRFFGSRAGMSVMSSSTDSTATARTTTKNSSFLVSIAEASIRLWLPSLHQAELLSGATRKPVPESLLLGISDFDLLFDSDKTRNITRIEARVPQLQLSVEAGNVSGATSSFILATRTMERSLDDRRRDTMLLLVLEAYSEPGTSYREQNVDVTLCSVTLSPSFDEELMPRVKSLFKAPAGVFENVEPNEVTRISFKAKDCSLYIAPPGTCHRASVAIGEASVKTKLTSHAPRTAVKLAIGHLDLFALESETSQVPSNRSPPRSASEHWVRHGFAQLVHIPESKGNIHLNTLTRPEVDVNITKLRVKLYATADTLDVVTGLVNAVTAAQVQASPEMRSKSELEQTQSTTTSGGGYRESRSDLLDRGSPETLSTDGDHSDKLAELMLGIEDDAYRTAAPIPIAADLVEDDVPSDAAFLGAKGRYHPEIVETTLDSDEFFGGESVASLSLLAPRTDAVIFADEDVTVRLLHPKGICPVPEYFTDPTLRPHVDSALGPAASSVRVRVSNFDMSLRLYSGYDWASTRKAVQQEAKLVRKRLQKIKQLLAEGQAPDDSVEAATSNLLDSIHISLPHTPAEMDADELMQALEEELGDHSEAASTAESDATASWQTLPKLRHDMHKAGSKSTAPSFASGAQHTKLQRSTRSLIDFNFRGLEVEFDKADPSQPSHVISRTAVNARRFEIIDNIKTSTWRTFLTEMQDRNTALSHDAESKMVKVEILNVRPESRAFADASMAETPEVRMRAKIAPLRLHVDQDALDFLKKFFMFKVPGRQTPPPLAQPASPALPFIQFAEVLPIKIKLDYKPKRVDYNLLRQGKTIEMMNFFHFEGAEMVLRHITLRGINGWARLFDTLNDIWTPDVKANQLADFLSGLGPIRSLVNVGAGLADLVLLPIEQYHKDGRVLRGMQKGAASFAKSTALEAVKLGARLATGTQVILEQAEHVLGGELRDGVTARAVGPDGSSDSYTSLEESIMISSMSSESHAGGLQEDDERVVSRYASQPDNMRDALTQAYTGLSEGLTSAAQTILAIPMEVYEPDTGAGAGSSGAALGGARGGTRPVVKALPIAILRGASGATQAIAKTMQGVQVSLGDSENVRERKYKQPSHRARRD